MATIPASFLDELRARTQLAALIGRRTRLVRSGRHWKGCCPLHGEKTPSFYVYDDHFHCFGCGAHGDGVAFVMQTQGASFPDAVEALANEAGLEIPRDPDPPARAEAVSRERRLLDVLEDAAVVFSRLLSDDGEGRRARDYLDGRGIDDETVGTWRLGWSGGGAALRPALVARGHSPALIAEAGLLSVGEDGAIRGEMFRNRVIFPINDRRGRVVGFGGRTLGDGQPKYLNGPETPVFSKRTLLYGFDRARARLRAPRPPEAARAGTPRPRLVIAEGYMDVLALSRAGLPAVAPLGTAITEEQLQAAWGLDPAPVLCLDGDAAGRRAAGRAAERALGLLAPERSLAIAALEQGEDPDSLLRRHGPAILVERVAAAVPLSAALYDLLGPPAADATPEARAAFRASLVEAAARIPDRALAAEYRQALLDRFFADRRRGRAEGPGRRPDPSAQPLRPALNPDLAREEQGCLLALIAHRHPDLLHDIEEAWERVELPSWLSRLRASILSATLDSDPSVNHLPTSGTDPDLARAEELVRRRGSLPRCATADTMPAEAEAGWWHFFGLLQHTKLDDEIRAAGARLASDFTEARVRQMTALIGARAELHTLGDEADS